MRRWVLMVPALVACGSKAPATPRAHDDAAIAVADPWAVPERQRHVVLRPRFVVRGAPHEAGSAFAIRVKERGPLLVTAQHLFGPDGGLDRTIAWRDMPREVSSVAATSVEDETVIATAGAPLAIEGAEGLSAQRASGDVAAFPITNLGGVAALELAASPPRAGSRVTLIAQLVDDGTTSIRHGATVFEDPGDGIYYVFDTPIELRATSGAPVGTPTIAWSPSTWVAARRTTVGCLGSATRSPCSGPRSSARCRGVESEHHPIIPRFSIRPTTRSRATRVVSTQRVRFDDSNAVRIDGVAVP